MAVELERMVEMHQKKLMEANVPGMVVTRDQDVIKLQRKILDIALDVESDTE